MESRGSWARSRPSMASLALVALAVRFAAGCRPPHAFGVLRIPGQGCMVPDPHGEAGAAAVSLFDAWMAPPCIFTMP